MSDTPDQPTTKFSEFIGEHRNGLADADLTEALREVVSAVARLGKAAKLTYTITVSPTKGDQLSVSDSLSVKVPQEQQERFYYVDLNGDLSKYSPLQPRLTDLSGATPAQFD